MQRFVLSALPANFGNTGVMLCSLFFREATFFTVRTETDNVNYAPSTAYVKGRLFFKVGDLNVVPFDEYSPCFMYLFVLNGFSGIRTLVRLK